MKVIDQFNPRSSPSSMISPKGKELLISTSVKKWGAVISIGSSFGNDLRKEFMRMTWPNWYLETGKVDARWCSSDFRGFSASFASIHPPS
jgi:hypothetical protein